jgi:hypothetical protein
LALGAALQDGVNYTVRVNNIEDIAGNVIAPNTTATFTFSAGNITPIADIQADPEGFQGQVVTVEGQAYIPTDYRGNNPTSGYIQDGSGRGINVFGTGADDPLLTDTSNIVRVTGTVDLFFTTVEILDITEVTLISSGNAPLQPAVLSTGAAANASWEGTFIESTGPITAAARGGPGWNYTINDGSGPIFVRVVDDLNATLFNVGQTITGRGAGGQFQTDFQILVGSADDVFESGTDTTPPTLVGATNSAPNQVQVTYSEPVTAATAEVVSNYELFETATPANTVTIESAALSGNGRTVTLGLASTLTDLLDYTVRVNNVQDEAGNTITPNSTVTFIAGGITPIAVIQSDPDAWEGRQVTVQGQVYIPANYRGDVPSGYIQDNSGRGVNLFGTFDSRLDDITNVVRVTGTVALFFTTVEIDNITELTLVSTGNPPLVPTTLTTDGGASSDWEGTFIRTFGEIFAKTSAGGAFNYTVNDGTGPIVVRVDEAIGAPELDVGQSITAEGAGGQFQSDFQILVGLSTALRAGDFAPPVLLNASLPAANEVLTVFNEALEPSVATNPDNYEIFKSGASTQPDVVTATFGAQTNQVVLGLSSNISLDDGYSVRVLLAQDLSGNQATDLTAVVGEAPPPKVNAVSLSGPPATFLPRQGEEYPITFTVTDNVVNGTGEAFLRIMDLTGRLRRTLFDSRFVNAPGVGFENNTRTEPWDGRDDFQELVPAGTYVVHYQVVDTATGDKQVQQMAVVVASRLQR